MKGGPLIASGLVHAGLMWALVGSVEAPSGAGGGTELIVFEPVRAAPELEPEVDVDVDVEAEAEPELEPEPAPDPEPEPARDVERAQPERAPASQEIAAAPAVTPAEPAPSPAGPRRLDLTLSNDAPGGTGGSAGGGEGSAKGKGAGSGGPGSGAQGGAQRAPGCTQPRTKPKPIARVTIEYPAAARAAGLEGRVVLQATVDVRGRVRAVEVLESAAAQIDGPAAEALRRWRFEPATRCGEPVEAPYVIAREFRLGD